MDCTKCHHLCKSECCSYVPFPRKWLLKYMKRRVRGIVKLEEIVGDSVIPLTADGTCPFLGEDGKCVVYKKRPQICRDFGSERTPMLRCAYMTSDDRIRSRQERRKIERDLDKRAKVVARKLQEKGHRLKAKEAYGESEAKTESG